MNLAALGDVNEENPADTRLRRGDPKRFVIQWRRDAVGAGFLNEPHERIELWRTERLGAPVVTHAEHQTPSRRVPERCEGVRQPIPMRAGDFLAPQPDRAQFESGVLAPGDLPPETLGIDGHHGAPARPGDPGPAPYPGDAGACARFHTRNVRRNEITTVPSWFLPVVRTMTTPASGREWDSRAVSTSLSE